MDCVTGYFQIKLFFFLQRSFFVSANSVDPDENTALRSILSGSVLVAKGLI